MTWKSDLGKRFIALDGGFKSVNRDLREGETFAELTSGFRGRCGHGLALHPGTVALLARGPKLRQAVRDAKKAGQALQIREA